jgi:ferric iron reductase protein FhuF
MIDVLSPFFQGPLEEVGAVLSIGDHPDAVNLAGFLEGGGLARALTLLSRRWREPDPRATATQWSKLYFSRLLPAALLPAMLDHWQLPLSPEQMKIRLDGEGVVTGLVLEHAGARMAQAPRFDFLIDGHLEPVISALAAQSGLPAKVLWNNAGNIFETILMRASALLGADHPGIAEGMHLLQARRRKAGAGNPLFEPVRYRKTDEGTVRTRRLCCLRYLTDGLGLCKSCPKSPAP